MSVVKNFAIGLGLASGALLTAWIVTGERKEKARKIITKKTADLREALKIEKGSFDDSEAHYI